MGEIYDGDNMGASSEDDADYQKSVADLPEHLRKYRGHLQVEMSGLRMIAIAVSAHLMGGDYSNEFEKEAWVLGATLEHLRAAVEESLEMIQDAEKGVLGDDETD